MADCNSCTTFLSASNARVAATKHSLIFEEICKIQQAILSAIDSGAYEITISDNTPMTSNVGIFSVDVVNGGSGYNTVPATAQITQPSGGIGALVTPVVTNGMISGFIIDNPGSGYQPIVAAVDSASIGDGNSIFQVNVNGAGEITSLTILNGGSGHSVNDALVITHPSGNGAVIYVTAVGMGGGITAYFIANKGIGYQTIHPQIQVNHPLGVGFAGTVQTVMGQVTGITITNQGSGYKTLVPTLSLVGSGSGATFNVNQTAGVITSVDIVTSGSGYSDPVTATVVPALGTAGAGAIINVEVENTGFNTNPKLYWEVLSGIVKNAVAKEQMDEIVKYFKCLGYNIRVTTNPNTMNSIQWEIKW